MDDIGAQLQRTLGDQYQLIRELGGGGMSHVFLAEEASLGRQVVVKVLLPELTSSASIARFKQEAALTAQLQHPNILPVLAFGARDGLLYYVTPFVAGESLRHRLARDGPLPIDQAVQLTYEVADALAAAHAHGVIHRDIKPENIFLSNGHAVLADFGIARTFEAGGNASGARLTAVGQSMGTPGYMSPEQAAGDVAVDARSDIYSLAVVAYEILAGVPPFTGTTTRAVLAAHLSDTPRPVTAHRRAVPVAVSAALDRALAKDPVGRFATAAEFRDALRSGGGAGAARRGRLAIVATLLLILMAAGAAWFISRSDSSDLDANLVAVAPFDVLDPSLAMWKEGIVDILSANLDGAGPLRTVPPTVVVRSWPGRADPASAATLGQSVRARYTIYGRFVRAGADSVRATATIYDVAAGRSLGKVEVRDVNTRLDRVADSLTIGILQQLNQSRPIAAVRTASIGTSSLPAIKAFLQAEQFYRRTEWDSAAAYYHVAIAADSTFAPALRHLSNVLGWSVAPDRAELERRYQYAFLAGQLNHGLAPRESLLVAADSIFCRAPGACHRVGLATPLCQSPLRHAGGGSEAFPQRSGSLAQAGGRALLPARFRAGHHVRRGSRGVRSRHRPGLDVRTVSYLHMPDLALRAQDPAAAARYIRKYLELETSSEEAGYLRMLLLFLDPDRAAAVDVDSLLRGASTRQADELTNMLGSWMDPAESQTRYEWHVRSSSSALRRPSRRHSWRGHARRSCARSPSAGTSPKRPG